MDPQALKNERNLSDDELKRVIDRAARLQRQAEHDRANAIDVVAVAGEVDVDAKYVEAAMTEMEAERSAAREREMDARRRTKTLKRIAIGGAVVLALVAVAGAQSASRRMGLAHDELQAAEARLQGALARQANLIPQLVAMSGGDPKPLLVQARKVIQADSATLRLQAADDFAAAISAALAALPKQDDARALNMHHEVAGAQNRITTERARYEVAMAKVEQAKSGAMATLARGLGWGRR